MQHLRYYVYRIPVHTQTRELVAGFVNEADAYNYGDEMIAGEFTRYEVEDTDETAF